MNLDYLQSPVQAMNTIQWSCLNCSFQHIRLIIICVKTWAGRRILSGSTPSTLKTRQNIY